MALERGWGSRRRRAARPSPHGGSSAASASRAPVPLHHPPPPSRGRPRRRRLALVRGMGPPLRPRGVAREFYVVGTVHTPGRPQTRSAPSSNASNPTRSSSSSTRRGSTACSPRSGDEDEDAIETDAIPQPRRRVVVVVVVDVVDGRHVRRCRHYRMRSHRPRAATARTSSRAPPRGGHRRPRRPGREAGSLPDELRARMTDDPADSPGPSLARVRRAPSDPRGDASVEPPARSDETLLEPRSNDTTSRRER